MSKTRFKAKWKALKSTEVYFKSEDQVRKSSENYVFWRLVGETIANDKNLKLIKFDTYIFKNNSDSFEELVLKHIPNKIEIHFRDETKEEKIEKWIQIYNVTFLYSWNINIAKSVSKARYLQGLFLVVTKNFDLVDELFKKEIKLEVLKITFTHL